MNNSRKFLLLWSGQLTSAIGSGLTAFGLGVYVLSRRKGIGIGRGMGLLIIIAGILLSVTSVILYNLKSVKKLEYRGDLCITE